MLKSVKCLDWIGLEYHFTCLEHHTTTSKKAFHRNNKSKVLFLFDSLGCINIGNTEKIIQNNAKQYNTNTLTHLQTHSISIQFLFDNVFFIMFMITP